MGGVGKELKSIYFLSYRSILSTQKGCTGIILFLHPNLELMTYEMVLPFPERKPEPRGTWLRLESTGQKQPSLCKPVLPPPSYVIMGKIFNRYASQFPNI